MSLSELTRHQEELQKQYDMYKNETIRLDMSRGKPSQEQLDLSMDMLTVLTNESHVVDANETDIRNYGLLDGIPEAKEWFGTMFEMAADQIIVGGNSSLALMHDTVARAMLHGVDADATPWAKLPKVKFICPTPGYDRHFSICELFDIEMISVEMTEDGPDMDQVETLVANDEAIKGIWCVPKYSNPEGITYSDQVVQRLSKMETKATDFRIFWDNAYAIHHLTDTPDELLDIVKQCEHAGVPNRVYQFASTSKVTFPGSGISAFMASKENIQFAKKLMGIQTIGADKINQSRHIRFFEQIGGVEKLMKQHATIIKPKFDQVLSTLEQKLAEKEIADWTTPNGGYFISLNTMEGCAKRVVSLAADVGVTLTGAGATYPYGKDPVDRNIRIAPTFPSLGELKKAMEILCLCVELAAVEKVIKQ